MLLEQNYTQESNEDSSNKQTKLELNRKKNCKVNAFEPNLRSWKPSKYFFSLESRNHSSKTIPKLKKEDLFHCFK